ncbi:MAG: HEAT repeat domain-containing protein, partial [Deltaproteobacteria bacterium]
LEAHPRGAHREEAKARLEALRFERAQAAPGPWALETFLERHPEGAHAGEARRLLAARYRAEALARGDVKALEAWLARFPDAAGAAEVRAALADKAVRAAMAAPTYAEIQRLLERIPPGEAHAAATLRARAFEVEAWVLDGRPAEARRRIEETGSPQARAVLEAAYTRARLTWDTLRLDADGLSALAGVEGPLGREAAARLDALRRLRPGARERLRALSEPATGLAPAVVEAGLASTDLRRRWVAVRALGYAARSTAIAPLREALTDRDRWLRFEAVRALRRLGESLPPRVRDVAFTRALARVRARSAGAVLATVEGALLEAAGRRAEARARYEAAAMDAPEQAVVARLRLAEMARDPRQKRIWVNGVLEWIEGDVAGRIEAIDASPDSGPLDGAGLRALAAREALLAEAVRIASAAERALGERSSFLEGARALLARLRRVRRDGEARARALDPTYVAASVDEGAAGREWAERRQLEAVRLLTSGVPPPLREVLAEAARRSPFEAVRAAAGGGRGTTGVAGSSGEGTAPAGGREVRAGEAAPGRGSP